MYSCAGKIGTLCPLRSSKGDRKSLWRQLRQKIKKQAKVRDAHLRLFFLYCLAVFAPFAVGAGRYAHEALEATGEIGIIPKAGIGVHGANGDVGEGEQILRVRKADAVQIGFEIHPRLLNE